MFLSGYALSHTVIKGALQLVPFFELLALALLDQSRLRINHDVERSLLIATLWLLNLLVHHKGLDLVGVTCWHVTQAERLVKLLSIYCAVIFGLLLVF